jgi:hypothetical protein
MHVGPVNVAQVVDQDQDERPQERIVTGQIRFQDVLGDLDDDAVLEGHRFGHPGAAVDDGHLAEQFTVLQGRQLNPPVLDLLENADLTRVDNVRGIALVALLEQDRALLVPFPRQFIRWQHNSRSVGSNGDPLSPC